MRIGIAAKEPIKGKRIWPEPHKDGGVWPQDCCPALAFRHSGLGHEQTCWFCRYADFRLKERRAMSVGICCWPEIQID